MREDDDGTDDMIAGAGHGFCQGIDAPSAGLEERDAAAGCETRAVMGAVGACLAFSLDLMFTCATSASRVPAA
jgi:hypothetical protein